MVNYKIIKLNNLYIKQNNLCVVIIIINYNKILLINILIILKLK